MSGHPDMPEFTFDADDVGAIIAYLKSIQSADTSALHFTRSSMPP